MPAVNPKPARSKRATASTEAAKPTPAGPSTTAKRGGAASTRRKGKYNANGCRIDGIWFASEAESVRYRQLTELVQAGVIDELETQVVLPVRINNELICTYRADFRYKVIDELGRTLRIQVEDVKGMKTDVYALKRKMVMAYHQIPIIEIPAKHIQEWAGRPS